MSYSPLSTTDLPNQAAASGSIASTVLTRCPVAGLYRVSVYIAPTVANALAAVTVTVNWVDLGIARTWTSTALSLASLANSCVQAMFPIYCDAGTNIMYSVTVTGTGGAFHANFGVRPPQ